MAILRGLGSSAHSKDARAASEQRSTDRSGYAGANQEKHVGTGAEPSLYQRGLGVRDSQSPGASTCNAGFSVLTQIQELEKARHGASLWMGGLSTCD